MDKRKLGIVLMLVAGITLPISLFSGSWRVFVGKDKTEWGSLTRDASYRFTTGLRSLTRVQCPRKGPCESRTFDYKWSLFKNTIGKAYYVFAQITFWLGLLTSALLLVGAWLLYARRDHGHTLMKLAMAGTLVVFGMALSTVMDPGLNTNITLHRAGFLKLGIGSSYVLFTVSCILAIVGVGRAQRATQ